MESKSTIDRTIFLQQDYEASMGADWPSYDDFKNGCEIPSSILAELEEMYVQTKTIYNSSDYNSEPDYKNLTDREKFLLTKSKYFCILPWIHLSSSPDGSTLPCCYADYKHPVGNLRKNTFNEIWNQGPYKLIRKNMLEEVPCKECNTCYAAEKYGIYSKRKESNKWYGHHIKEVQKTKEDGFTDNFKITYLDIRFSNLCNFKCRTCGPGFSSNWYHDYIKLHNKKPKSIARPDEDLHMINVPIDNEDFLFDQIEPHIPYFEEIYFAGGEPLIMKEHYRLLDKLIEYNKTDIRLIYNTNFSELRYKDKHVFDYWEMFKSVRVGASLDGSDLRAEYIRKGADWNETVENRRSMIEKVPNVEFWITSTVSAMNVLHILDFHKQMVDEQMISAAEKLTVSTCLWPEHYRPNIFPRDFKNKVIVPAYEKHIEWLQSHDGLGECTNKFINLLNFIKTDSENSLYSKFLNETSNLDEIRNENFWEIFPEFHSLNNNGL